MSKKKNPVYYIEPLENGFLLILNKESGATATLNNIIEKFPSIVDSIRENRMFNQTRETDQEEEASTQKFVFSTYKELEGFLRLKLAI